MMNDAVENLRRRQTLMPEDGDGHVADAECFAGVDLGIRDADRPLHKLRIVRHGETQAVVGAADEEIALHVSLPISRPEPHRKPRSPRILRPAIRDVKRKAGQGGLGLAFPSLEKFVLNWLLLHLPFDGRPAEEHVSRADRAIDFSMAGGAVEKNKRLEKIKPVV